MNSKIHMTRVVLVVAVGILISSCMTINELDTVDLRGAGLAAHTTIPPQPEIDISYDMKFDPKNPVATVISVGTNLAKAQVAAQAEVVMLEALRSVDLPRRVFDESYIRCAEALGAVRVSDDQATGKAARFVFEMEIRSYGIEASSYSGNVNFNISLVASIRDNASNDLLWRRSMSIKQQAHPGLFGVPSEVGSVLSAAALASLTEDSMRIGFDRLVGIAATDVARKLEQDIRRARSASL